MKKAIIIGASSGIGKSLAQLLVCHHYSVGITGRRLNLLETMRNEKPDHYVISNFDITNSEQIAENLEKLTLALGGLDLLVISAGYGELNEPLDFEIEKQTILTNVAGFTAAADWAFNYFRKQKQGHLVVITSIAGLRGYREAPAYNASKAYQINYLEGLRQKTYKLRLPITITDIRPGFVDTAMAKSDYKFWIAPVDEAARQIYQAILRKKCVAYITKRWTLIASLYKLIPRHIYKLA